MTLPRPYKEEEAKPARIWSAVRGAKFFSLQIFSVSCIGEMAMVDLRLSNENEGFRIYE